VIVQMVLRVILNINTNKIIAQKIIQIDTKINPR